MGKAQTDRGGSLKILRIETLKHKNKKNIVKYSETSGEFAGRRKNLLRHVIVSFDILRAKEMATNESILESDIEQKPKK